MDRIFINNLSVDTIIGIYDHERVTPQRITLHLEMSADIANAAASEDIESTICYKTVCETLTSFIQQSSFQLVETLAEQVTDILRKDFGVSWVKLTLHKPDALPGDVDVGVIIERGSSV